MRQEKRHTPLRWEPPHASPQVVGTRGDLSVVVAVKGFLYPACFQHPGCLLFPDQLQSQNVRQRRPGQTVQTQEGMEIGASLYSEREKIITVLPAAINVYRFKI